MLLARGADPNQPDAEGLTPLARAVARHDQKTASLLLSSGASPNIDPPGPDGSVLEQAVREGWTDLVTLLVSRGASPTTLSREGQAMLPLAVALGRADVTAALLDAGADIETPLVNPVSEDFMALVPGKYARHYMTRDDGVTPLMVAVLRGDLQVARLLRDRKASVGPTRTLVKYPLGMAANRKDIPMMQVLLGRDPDEAAKARHIVVSLSQQKATLYEADNPTIVTRVSTGRKEPAARRQAPERPARGERRVQGWTVRGQRGLQTTQAPQVRARRVRVRSAPMVPEELLLLLRSEAPAPRS